MKLTIGLVAAAVLAFFSSSDLSAQEVGAPLAQPIVMSSGTSIQTFTIDNGGTHQIVSLPVYGFGGGGNLNSLHDPSVMKDLELVDDQVKQIAEVRKEYNKLIQSAWKDLSKVKDDKQRRKDIQKQVARLQTEQKEALSNVLLPHQLDRIKQVNQQMEMQAMGGEAGALQHGQLAKDLEISVEQKKRLAEIQKEMNAEITEKTKQIRAAAKKKVRQELTNEQKRKLDEMTGAEFKRNSNDWQEHRKRIQRSRNRN